MIDTCGTGGDGAGTFNVSTLAGLVAAACGARVAKHGNRAVSSRCGSADLLEALGLKIDGDPGFAAASIKRTGFGFLFAPHYHQTLRHLAAIRRELGFRSIFNLVGPLANPALVKRQVVGVPQAVYLQPVALALQALGAEHALVVHGDDGSDEISLTSSTTAVEVRPTGLSMFTLRPEDVGLSSCRAVEVAGGEAATNAAIARSVLDGERGPASDFVMLNAAAALVVAGLAASLREGVLMARDALLSARARHRRNVARPFAGGGVTFLDDVIAVKEREVTSLPTAPARFGAGTPRPSLESALRNRGLSVIAEIKRRSPSKGVLAPNLDARALSLAYARGSASAISCLTDREFFGAEAGDLEHARAAGLPVLRKDFLIDERQIHESVALGASAVLLIARILEPARLAALLARASEAGMDALVEVHTEEEIDRALQAGARIIGINNRDLDTLQVDVGLALRLRPRIPETVLSVAESGVRTRDDLKRVEAAGFDAVLIGETLATNPDPAAKLRELLGQVDAR